MRVAEKAYLAGLIDGEGCVAVIKQKESRYRYGCHFGSVIVVSMTHKGILNKMQRLTKLGRISFQKRRNQNHADIWQWRICSRETVKLLNQITSFLVVKKEQARNLIAFQNSTRRRCRISKKEFDRQNQHYKISRRLNRTGPKP